MPNFKCSKYWKISKYLKCNHMTQSAFHSSFKVTTKVSFESGAVTWLSCGGCVFLGCCLGCCLIPFCIDALKDAIHTCPNCKKVITRKGIMG